MRYHRILIAGLASLALCGVASAQSNIGRSGAQFLKISPSARATALGGAYGSVGRDADAVYHNPAGIAGIRGMNLNLARVNYVADISFNYIAAAMPLGSGALGFQFGSMMMDEMPVTTIQDPTNQLGITFDVGSWVAGITYAQPLTDRLSVGVTGKYVRESIWDMSSSTVALDVGTLYYTGFCNWRFSAVLSNFGRTAKFTGGRLVTQYNKYDNPNQSETVAEDVSMAYELPQAFKLGTAYDFTFTDQMMVTGSLEGAHPIDAPEYLSGGLEYTYAMPQVKLAARAGYRIVQTEAMGSYSSLRLASDSAVLGLGIGVPIAGSNLQFDYTWQNYMKLGNNHLFSVGVSF